MACGGGVHVLHETVEFLVFLGQFAALHASGERSRLLAQLGLHAGEEFGGVGSFLLRGVLVALLLPGCGDDFLFALGDVVLIAAHAAATAATSAARCLRLREFALERIGLDEGNVGARFGVRVLGRGVEADDVAGHQLEIFEGKNGGAVGLLRALLLEQIDRLLGPAVHRIVQRHLGRRRIRRRPSPRR